MFGEVASAVARSAAVVTVTSALANGAATALMVA